MPICPSIRHTAFAAWVLSAFFFLSGCAEVSPWERGNLAKPHVALEPDPAQALLRTHAYRSREAAAAWGEATGPGAGCGCY